MAITEHEKIIAELAVLHEISSFELLDSEEEIGRNAIAKASRLFGIRYFALCAGKEDGQKVIASWGFRNPADIHAKMREEGLNQFRYSFREFGLLFMEHSHPLSVRERRLYTIFARQMEKTLMYAENIAERRQAEEELNRWNKKLELKIEERTRQLVDAQEELVRKEKLSILGKLSGSVGHELRNPLGVMSNAVYFLKTVLSGADDTTKEYLDIIKKEIETSQRIIDDMLGFARTKKPQARLITVDELVRESLAKCAIPDIVTLQLEIPETLPRLHVDPLQMVQVLVNFITNAVQAMPEGGSVRISARRVASSKGQVAMEGQISLTHDPLPLDAAFVEISVTDTGEGISPENRKKLFQPLFTTKAKGIGLGLVVCKNLVEANGGRIDVASEVGKGTTFTMTLPAESETGKEKLP
jgi:signal transduction histidine kinase